MEFETCYALIGELEIRQGGGSRIIRGRFPMAQLRHLRIAGGHERKS